MYETMCGIAGLLGPGIDAADIHRMTTAIRHRGPDDAGAWLDKEAGVALGHRRLSIVDLSPAGHQPMASLDGRLMLSFNGEIYNHAALRAELDAHGLGPASRGQAWRGSSDTETLIECISAWGLAATVEKSRGMFALAIWDKSERTLSLARDRFGEKPLYYGWVGGQFAFASELKAMRTLPRFDNSVSRRALRMFMARTYVPAPHTIFERIFKLLPGHVLSIDADAARTPRENPPGPGETGRGIALTPYWSYRDVVSAGLANPIADEVVALDELERALATAIAGQAVADVPVGAFLSGGIDSSTVVALYSKYGSGRVKTYSIGFEEGAFNEAPFAAKVAAHFGTEHHERIVTVVEAQAVIPDLPTMYDEPFADSSQIPTHLVSRFAREDVTVALSGDGGDELFGGYNRYVQLPHLWSRVHRVPRQLRKLVGVTLGHVPARRWNALARLRPGGGRHPNLGTKVRRGLRLAGAASSIDDVYFHFLDEWADANPLTGDMVADQDLHIDLNIGANAPDAARLMYGDAMAYLPDDILCKVDRAAMAVSLETRVPFLDHHVAAVAARIPISMKIRDGKGKQILRRLLYQEAPAALFKRPKAGFAIPLGEWLRGPLRDWAEAMMDPARLAADGYFDQTVVRACWDQHLRGTVDATPALWSVLMFQAWLDTTTADARQLFRAEAA